MPIIDDSCLNLFRCGPCEFCHRKGRTEANHVTSRGMGGSMRYDVRINLCAMCRKCHQKHHDGGISRDEIVALVAKREGMSVDEWWDAIWKLRREDKR